jgi:hypothetical protein
MSSRSANRSRRPGTRYILVIEPCAERRGALLQRLAAEGYQSIGTTSMQTACALLQAPQVKLVLVNVSAFSGAALRELGRVLTRRRDVRVLAVVSHVSPAPASSDSPGGLAGGRVPETSDGSATFLLRLSGADQLAVGLHRCHPN